MLSYRHAFHAGMHADVLKHCVLMQALKYLLRKDKPLWYIDTHAGADSYALHGEYASKNAEFESGIGRLWPRTDLPPLVADYVELVRADNREGALKYYPGSPRIAERLLRKPDRLRLFELHSTEVRGLAHAYRHAAPRVLVQAGDGFAGLLALLPPPSRRGLVLIDPSYEDKEDYRRVVKTLEGALRRFATGTFLVWYPKVARREAQQLPQRLMQLKPTGWVHASLTVKAAPVSGLGLYGSGIFIVNPPYTLEAELRSALPYLARVLGQDERAGFELEARPD